MHKILKWYNQNRLKVWFGIVAIFIVLLVYFNLREKYISTTNSNGSGSIIPNVDNSKFNSVSISSNKSIVTGKSKTIDNNEIDIIDKFISYCNSGNVQEAYNLLSNECKEVMYKEINIFNEAYYKPIFANGKRNANVEIWNNDIYMVTLNEDALATGSFSEENSFKDYITIVKDKEGNTKLNINGYIRRTEYNKTHIENSLEITVLRKDSYMDYEIYTFNLKNNSDIMAELGNVQDAENVSYLLDDSNFKCEAYVHELIQTQLDVYGKQEKTLQIKYFNDFNSNVHIKKLVFPRVLSNYTSNNYSEVVFEF